MKVELHLYASFKNHLPEKSGGNPCIVEIPDGTSIRELLSRLNIPPEAPKVVFLNGVHTKGDEILKEGDRVGAFPPVAGGSFGIIVLRKKPYSQALRAIERRFMT